jgi:hypothetical protein
MGTEGGQEIRDVIALLCRMVNICQARRGPSIGSKSMVLELRWRQPCGK